MAKFCAWTLEPLFSSSEPTSEARVGMGATVDIQRQQRMELGGAKGQAYSLRRLGTSILKYEAFKD